MNKYINMNMNMDIDTDTSISLDTSDNTHSDKTIEYKPLLELLNDVLNNQICFQHIKDQYLQILSYLSHTEPMTNEFFYNKICEINKIGTIIVCYIKPNVIIGTGTIIIEPKIIHGGRYVGHIEDVVIHPLYRNKKIASGIINKLITYGTNCYKIILDCDESLKSFYEKNGFNHKNIQMSMYK